MVSRIERHTCHAEGCVVKVPPRMFMCKKHWFMLPLRLRGDVWATYEAGQELRMDPTNAYLDAAHAAIEWLAEKEGRRAD